MRIYSWNVWFKNKRLDEAFNFIAHADFDIFCLQEVPNALLDRLQTLGTHLASTVGTDFVHDLAGNATRLNNVILSRHPIVSHRGFPLPLFDDRIPLSGSVLSRFLVLIGLWVPIHHRENRNGLRVDIDIPKFGRLRILCVHLSLASPERRTDEFKLVFKEASSTYPTLICGDFNVLETWYTACANWLTGGSLKDALFPKRERRRVENNFKELGFLNPLRGRITHPFTRSQLDHILVPAGLKVRRAQVEPKAYGSDHRPICVEFELTHLDITEQSSD